MAPRGGAAAHGPTFCCLFCQTWCRFSRVGVPDSENAAPGAQPAPRRWGVGGPSTAHDQCEFLWLLTEPSQGPSSQAAGPLETLGCY